MRSKYLLSFLPSLCLVLLISACSLSNSNTPPTLVPRVTAVPQPTLGYSTLSPQLQTTPVPVSAPSFEIELFNLFNEVETDRLMIHVDTLQGFQTRHVNSSQTSDTRGIGAAYRYIENQFKTIQQSSQGRLAPLLMDFPLTYNRITTTQHNVLAILPGTDPEAGWLIVGAHYDSVGGVLEDAASFAPGAVDNASGVGAVIELARVLSQSQHRSTILFVAFSAEEEGRRGSIALASWLEEREINVMGMINIDGVGNVNGPDGSINDTELRIFSTGPENSPSRQMARSAELMSFQYSFPLLLIVEDAIDREARYGDHFSFSEKGYPAIRIMQANEEKHNADPTDTVDYIEAGYYQHAVQSILAVILSLVDGPPPPRNIVLRHHDNGLSTLIWEPVGASDSYVVALRHSGSLVYDQMFATTENSIDWDGFSDYVGIAVAAVDMNGLIGPLPLEYEVHDH